MNSRYSLNFQLMANFPQIDNPPNESQEINRITRSEKYQFEKKKFK